MQVDDADLKEDEMAGDKGSEASREADGEEERRAPVYVREMIVEDIAPVFHLGEQLFTADEVQNLHRTWDEYEAVSLFQSETRHCLVAESEGRVVGFALGTVIEKRKSSWTYGYLLWLGVDPSFQNEGLARRLFRQFKQRMAEDGARILMVDTQADNETAIRFFQRQGFENAEEHIYMSLNIDDERRDVEARESSRGGREGSHRSPSGKS